MSISPYSTAGIGVLAVEAAIWLHATSGIPGEAEEAQIKTLMISAVLGVIVGILEVLTLGMVQKYLDLGLILVLVLYPLLSLSSMALPSMRRKEDVSASVGVGVSGGISFTLVMRGVAGLDPLMAFLYSSLLALSMGGSHVLSARAFRWRPKLSVLPLIVVYGTMLLWWWMGSPPAALTAGAAEGLFMYYLYYRV